MLVYRPEKQIRICLILLIVFCVFSCRTKNDDANIARKIYELNKIKIIQIYDKIFSQNPNFRNFNKKHINLIVSDFDHTLVNTETRIPVIRKDGSQNTIDSKCTDIRQGDKADFNVLTEKELKASAIVAPGIKRLQSFMHESNYLVIMTARSQTYNYQAIPNFLNGYQIKTDLVIPINESIFDTELWQNLVYPAEVKKIPAGMKKPILILALHDYAKMKQANLNEIIYMEDTDDYIQSYIRLLPYALPQKTARVYDYIRMGEANQRSYQEQYIGYTSGQNFVDAGGKVLDYNKKTYTSGDCHVD